jgi:hypothetical protein
MIYFAKILQTWREIEEELIFEVHETRVKGFASYMTKHIEVGMIYAVRLHVQIFDEYRIDIAGSLDEEYIHFNDTDFSCTICGQLEDRWILSLGILFEDESICWHYPKYTDKKIILSVDRLDVEFLDYSETLRETIKIWNKYPIDDEWLFSDFREYINTLNQEEAFRSIEVTIQELILSWDQSTNIELLQTIINLSHRANTTEIPTSLRENMKMLEQNFSNQSPYEKEKFCELLRYYRISQ